MEEKEKSKGFSLRKKASRRLPLGASKKISGPIPKASTSQGAALANGSAKTSLDTLRERPKLGGNTSDLVKRRYSTRFTQVPDFSNAGAPPVPSVPAIPTQFAQPELGRGAPASGQGISIDINALRDPNLQAEKYVNSLLANASEQEIRDYQVNLRKIKNRTSTDLQQNVYRNRTQFIKISKEAEKLKGEMRTLRGLMSELTSALGQASVASASSASGRRTPMQDDGATRARKMANRSSVANLEAMWSAQLQTLWKNVEGSQKFLPAIPGRHIVLELGSWVELDAATWKSRRATHIFLLNDQLMVATRKRKRADPNTTVNGGAQQKAPTKLVADRCWALQDIDLIDLGSNSHGSNGVGHGRRDIANAVSISCGQESFTYRSESSASTEKTNLLLTFRRTVDELRRALRTDADEASSKGKETLNYFATRDGVTSQKTDLLESLNSFEDRPEVLIDVDGKQKNLRWVEEQIDELDIKVALQRFEDAVRLVEKLRRLAKGLKGNMIAQELISIKVDERAAKLADLVAQRLIDTHSFSNATQTNVAWLVRLGFEDRARASYLTARTTVITKRTRQCIFEGDLPRYIFQVSYVYFTLIRNTVSIYQQCFPPLMMSACVKWAKEHLDGFNVLLSRQLSSVEGGSPIWQDCIDRAKEHATTMNEVGLDFKELVGVRMGTEDSDEPVGLGVRQ